MSGVTLAFGWHIGEREENVNKQDDDYGSSQLIIESACCRNEHDSHTYPLGKHLYRASIVCGATSISRRRR